MSEELTTLAECPPGLFMTPDFCIGLKTEYAHKSEADGRYYPEAYVGASGEFFWGGVSTHPERAALKVIPLDCDELGRLKAEVEQYRRAAPDLHKALGEALEALRGLVNWPLSGPEPSRLWGNARTAIANLQKALAQVERGQ